jgi:hypothetical protein
MCTHEPPCPRATDSGREAARVVASYPEQGWIMLCNGVVVFDDTGELMPDGSSVAPHRPGVSRTAATAHRARKEIRALVARFASADLPLGLRLPEPQRGRFRS